MAGVADDRAASQRAAARCMRSADLPVARVAFADDEQSPGRRASGNRDQSGACWPAPMPRRLLARPERVVPQALRAFAGARTSSADVGRQLPAAAGAPTRRRTRRCRRCRIRSASAASLSMRRRRSSSSSMPGEALSRMSVLTRSGACSREVQRHPAAHRVAEHVDGCAGRSASSSADQVARRPVEAVARGVGGRRRATMADQVDRDQPGERGQRWPHLVPGAHAAGEAVQQQQRRPAARRPRREIRGRSAASADGDGRQSASATASPDRAMQDDVAGALGRHLDHLQPAACRPSATAARKPGQSATRTKRPP